MRGLLKNLALGIALFMGAASLATSQGVILPVQNGFKTAPSIFGIGDSSSGVYFGTGFVGISKHLTGGLAAGANLPVLSACGTSPALGTGSNDFSGKITVGTTAANACTLTFGTAYTTAPSCVVQNATTGAAANVYAVTASTIVWSSALADSSVLFYHCIGTSDG